MNINPLRQNDVTLAWTGSTATAVDLRTHTNFGISFQVIAALGADTIFKFQAAPPSTGDDCVAGTFADVKAVAKCDVPVVTDELYQVVIPAGTPIGTKCSVALDCIPNAFLRLASVSGETADVVAFIVKNGPRR